MLRLAHLLIFIRVLLDQEDESTDHISLRTMNVFMLIFGVSLWMWRIVRGVFVIIGIIFSKISIHPYFHLSFSRNEDHFLDNIKIPDLFIEQFETTEGGKVHVEQIIKWNIINFLQSQVHFVCIQIPRMDGGTHFISRFVHEISNGKHKWLFLILVAIEIVIFLRWLFDLSVT